MKIEFNSHGREMLDCQHGRREVTCKPAMQQLIYYIKLSWV